MTTTTLLEAGPELTAPVRVDGDRDGSKTLVLWLKTHKLLVLALPENLEELSKIVDLELAIPVFQRVQEVKRKEPDHPGFAPRSPHEIEAGFTKLAGAMRGMFR